MYNNLRLQWRYVWVWALSEGVLWQGEMIIWRCRKAVAVVRRMGVGVVVVEVVLLGNGDVCFG